MFAADACPARLLTACAAVMTVRVGVDQLRIDEAVKEKEKGANRIGETKTETSDAWVAVPPELARDLKAWVARHAQRHDPRAFLFPTATGTAYRVGNFLKRVLKPLAKIAGIEDFDFRAMRSTSVPLGMQPVQHIPVIGFPRARAPRGLLPYREV